MAYTRYNSLIVRPENVGEEEFAREISAVIMDEYEPLLIEKSIEKNYGFLERDEIEKIGEIARTLEWSNDKNEIYPPFVQREALVRARALEYLSDGNAIVPRGLADFRIRELSVFAEAISFEAAESYFARREYEEFTELLSMFISVRPSMEKAVHVVWDDGRIRLFNRRRRDITAKYENEFLPLSEENGAKDEDIALSALIAAAPEKIVLHSPPDSPFAETIQKVFEGRCTVCRGCDFCKKD